MDLALLKEKGKDVKLVVFDLDGTLLTSKSRISDLSILAIKELKKQGFLIAIASGRIFTMLETYYKAIDLKDFVISSNGASIDWIETKETIQKITLDPEDANKVIEYCLLNQIECAVLTRKACYFPKDSYRLTRFEIYNQIAIEQGLTPIDVIVYEDMHQDWTDIEKILIYEKNAMKISKAEKFIDTYTKLIYTTSDHNMLDISSIGVSKGAAVQKIAEHLRITPEQVCVFGDYDNDVSMFLYAGIAIATENGSKKALKNADFITLSNDNEGIAYAIKEILLR
jgi:Cof subfamily protein (haloacid dehalogenase superfamily)